ncbi:unnamed protein product [Darwinula stevensoni]|uniref:Ankyrin repeat family A protein 2 n=1 Tax=Darwinula stevensoni TaxID=69355 RepID=A0A7R8X4M0_9CRUS|nr:unnamed protein product [Darwinula stevensoni]CAG0879682.1 unnamed protein product [Darwinula stevensoni]
MMSGGVSKEEISPDREVQEVLKNELEKQAAAEARPLGKPHVPVANYSLEPILPSATKAIGLPTDRPHTSGFQWSPRLGDGSRSAFSPYRPSTLLTNMSRGNVRAECPHINPNDFSLYQRAAQGELSLDTIPEMIDATDGGGLTLLMWASAYGQLLTVQMLLKKGADVCKQGKNGETALMLACSGGHVDVTRVLLTSGASHNVADTHGNTALMYAAHADSPHCVSMLLKAGANIMDTNLKGDSAYGIAVKRRSSLAQTVMEQYLLSMLAGA